MYRIVEHTADLAIEAEGDTPGECLSEAAQALVCIATGRTRLHDIRPEDELVFEVRAPDREALAVAFLAEVLWFLEEEGVLWLGGGADVGTLVVPGDDPDGLREPWTRPAAFGAPPEDPRERVDWVARARGNAVVYDPALHGRGTEVKAVTYNALRFAPDKGRWSLRAVVDI